MKKRKLLVFGSILAVVIGSWFLFGKQLLAPAVGNHANYTIAFDVPEGWVVRKHSPLLMFAYQSPDKHKWIQGAVGNIVSRTSVEEEQSAARISARLIRNMKEIMPQWKVLEGDPIQAGDLTFYVIERHFMDRHYMTAIGSKGNASATIMLNADGPSAHDGTANREAFKQFVSTVRFVPEKQSDFFKHAE